MNISNAGDKLDSDIVILDAPGINGSGGALSRIRFAAYTQAGGPILHPINPPDEHKEKVAFCCQGF